jgi:5,10-methylenetetrahydrofolate reductase
MVNGHCEVLPERPCIWNKIHSKIESEQWHNSLREPVSQELFGTSSWLNFLDGSDRAGRLPSTLRAEEMIAPSRGILAATVEASGFLVTTELRTPKADSKTQLQNRIKDATLLKESADSICVTSHPGTMRPQVFCQHLYQDAGIETIMPLIGRDIQPGEIEKPLAHRLDLAGTAAVLCLSGDFAGTTPFPMDSAQILLALRRMSWGLTRPLFGAALHVQAQPRRPALARAAQKVLAGAEIFFSQLLLGREGVAEFIGEMREISELKYIPLVLGLPLVGSKRGFEALERIPGVDRLSPFLQRLRNARDVASLGPDLGTELVEFALSLRSKGVVGIHVMPFGMPAADAASWIRSQRIPRAQLADNLEKGSLR